MNVNWGKRRKPFVIWGVLGRRARAGEKRVPSKAPHFPILPQLALVPQIGQRGGQWRRGTAAALGHRRRAFLL